MFVKLYRYKIKTKDFEKWKKNNDEAWKIYLCDSKTDYKRLIKKGKIKTEIIELGFYNSKSDYTNLMKNLNKNKQLGLLFKNFLKIAVNEKFIEEQFETI